MAKNGKPITYPKDSESKLKEANRQLRAEVKRLKNKIKQMSKERKTLERSFDKNIDYISDMVDRLSVEEVIETTKAIGETGVKKQFKSSEKIGTTTKVVK